MSNILQSSGLNVRQEVETLKIQIELLNSRIRELEKLNEQNVTVLFELAKSHNGSIDITQKLIKNLAQNIDTLSDRIKDMEERF